ncbi:glycoside hydrolase family 36 protein [Nonomuraea guangzhouensis]|uniref:Glycoside hydrolase family 36 protein n=1 Tax=Nonomuraea guangzhouensis TaxID=1291555 RepID=A0ABW4GSQ3_9ACTN|nr:glycoside hydrolase family 36 protein [Nonomuraea guangzhouensis]
MSVTTAGLAPAPTEPLLDDVRLAVLTHTPGATVRHELAARPDGTELLEIHSDGELEIRLSVPLGDAAGFWHPDAQWNRTIVADWAGLTRVSLVRGAVAGCLYDSGGTSMLAFAALDPVPETTMRYGVSEENKTFVVHLRVPAGRSPYRMAFARSSPTVATALRKVRGALGAGPAAVPEGARVPVYSTWYGFTQAVEASAVEAEARLAAELGCGTIILDDGWQELGNRRGYHGVGDWRPDLTKFPDFAGHVGRVREMGLNYVAWVAPLLLGLEAECFPALAAHAPETGGVPGAHVLDPRIPEVREHVVRTCVRLVRDYGLDGLKIDFLDRAMTYAGTPSPGDIADVGTAMRDLLAEVVAEVEAVRPGALIELRQPYVGPGMTPFGNMLRANDCPADAVANRVRTIDIGLLTGSGAVHADMLMWDPAAPARAAARQLIGALHSVPQISARLGELSGEHRRMVAFWLRRWRELRPVLLDGEVEPGRPDELYPVVRASLGDRCVISVTADRVVTVDAARHAKITVVNGTASDRLVLEVGGGTLDVAAIFHADCSRVDVDGSRIEPSDRRLGPGLCVLAVPPSGQADLEVTR